MIDDDPGLVRLLLLRLRSTDRYEVQAELDATQAVQTVVEFKPHLVLLDWVMPKITGGEVARRIRADARISDTPILFLSSIVGKEPSRQIDGIPAIAKPIGLKELTESIEEQLVASRR